MFTQTACAVNKIGVSLRRSCFARDSLGLGCLGAVRGRGESLDPCEAHIFCHFFQPVWLLSPSSRPQPVS